MTTFKLANTYPAKKQKDKKMEQDNKPKRKRITSEQLQSLTELFQETETPTFDLRESLAKKLNMTNREVQVWFQNRRAKANRIKQQQQKKEYTYWSTSSSMNSSSSSSPLLLPEELFINTQSPIDILATAAAYIQDKDQQLKKRKLEEEQESTMPKKKSWRPWL